MRHLGEVPASSTLYIPFATYDGSGASVTMTNFVLGDILIYKNGSTTQRSSTAGIVLLDTDGIDFDAITGLHGFSIDLSDNTDAGFYAVGSFYWVVVSVVTISGQTVTLIPATFRIIAAEAVAGKRKVDVDAWLGTAAATPATAGIPDVNVKNAANTAWASGAITAASIAADAITAAKIADGSIDAATFAAGAINAAAIAADAITAAKIADGAIDAATFAAGAINAAAIATDAITAAKIAADAIGASELAADAVTEIQSGLATAAALNVVDDFLDTEIAAILAAVDTEIAAIVTATGASAIRAAVGLASANMDTQLAAIAGFIDTEIASIVSAVSAASIRSAIGLASANLDTQLDALPTNGELATALGTADDAVLAAIAALTAAPTANANADALLDRANAIEAGLTLREAMRVALAALGGKVSGAGTGTETFRNAVADTKNRIVATDDVDGNRTAITYDLT